MNSDATPSLSAVKSRLLQLIVEGQRLIGDSQHNDHLMPDAKILVELEAQILKGTPIQPLQHPVVETSSREILYNLLISTKITEPSFRAVWLLLDVIHLLGDNGSCEPVLFFWLIEELLDSQSIDGCRIVFDYLESRREILVAKDFQKKHLAILRSCNELLRRLSRAEDAVFCGRVFIFLFQSFPLGDKSSVNLRGEFHVENVTAFETEQTSLSSPKDEMDVDITSANHTVTKIESESNTANESGMVEAEKSTNTDSNTLYPMFWTLQQSFSNPPCLFKKEAFDTFKRGLQATIEKFKNVPQVFQGGNRDSRRIVMQNYDNGVDEFAKNYNPKYLTSKDLFKLELCDISFQRHILVQALILLDFLLSLTEESKKKIQAIQAQKALQYNFTLSEEDTKWVLAVKNNIANYLQDGPDGKFYYRMVDTVLTRDKNWVRWKLESCQPITRPPVSAEDMVKAKAGIARAGVSRRLRPIGSLNLDFLSDPAKVNSLETLKEIERHGLPSEDVMLRSIEGDELDKEMASTIDERKMLDEAILSKTWKLLRASSKSKLAAFDKINNGKELQRLFDTSDEHSNYDKMAHSEGSDEIPLEASQA